MAQQFHSCALNSETHVFISITYIFRKSHVLKIPNIIWYSNHFMFYMYYFIRMKQVNSFIYYMFGNYPMWMILWIKRALTFTFACVFDAVCKITVSAWVGYSKRRKWTQSWRVGGLLECFYAGVFPAAVFASVGKARNPLTSDFRWQARLWTSGRRVRVTPKRETDTLPTMDGQIVRFATITADTWFLVPDYFARELQISRPMAMIGAFTLTV